MVPSPPYLLQPQPQDVHRSGERADNVQYHNGTGTTAQARQGM